jgi:holo-[acyl-carrier protein] synthase
MIAGLGHDVFEVARMEAELCRGGSGLPEVFTAAEAAYCEARRYPARHFAARFAAKEAVLKALGADPTRGPRWREVEIRNAASGQPRVLLHGETGEAAKALRVGEILLSLSHTATLAAATVVLVRADGGPHPGER